MAEPNALEAVEENRADTDEADPDELEAVEENRADTWTRGPVGTLVDRS